MGCGSSKKGGQKRLFDEVEPAPASSAGNDAKGAATFRESAGEDLQQDSQTVPVNAPPQEASREPDSGGLPATSHLAGPAIVVSVQPVQPDSPNVNIDSKEIHYKKSASGAVSETSTSAPEHPQGFYSEGVLSSNEASGEPGGEMATAATAAVALNSRTSVSTGSLSGTSSSRTPSSAITPSGSFNPTGSFNPASSASSLTLDQEASQNLRKFAKRNRPPNRDKFKTQPAASTLSTPTLLNVPGEAAEPVEEKEMPTLDQKIMKFDIFDDIDGDRLKEFDDLFAKVMQSSNYEAHKKKTKSLNKNKFSTACAVTTDEETGQTSIT